MANPLYDVPGLGGYLAKQQFDQQSQHGQVAQLMGLANLIETQKQRGLQAQMLQAQLAQKQREEENEMAGQQRLAALAQHFQALQQPQTVQDADYNETQTPGLSQEDAMRRVTSQMVFDPNRHVADRGAKLQTNLDTIDARREQGRGLLEQRVMQANQQHEYRMGNLQTAQQRAEETARHNRVMEGFTAQMRSLAASNAGSRNRQTINTAEGIMELLPGGGVRPLTDESGRPLRPPSLTAGDRGDRRDAMTLYRETENDPQVKTFKAVTPKFDTTLKYFQDVSKDPSKQSNAQDLMLTKTFMSMIHPKGDQISNMDLKDVRQMPGIDERIVGAVMNVVDGKQLQPNMRADIMRQIIANYSSLNAQVIGIEDRRRQEAQNFGLDPDKAIPRVGRREGKSPAAATGQPRVIDFNDLPQRR